MESSQEEFSKLARKYAMMSERELRDGLSLPKKLFPSSSKDWTNGKNHNIIKTNKEKDKIKGIIKTHKKWRNHSMLVLKKKYGCCHCKDNKKCTENFKIYGRWTPKPTRNNKYLYLLNLYKENRKRCGFKRIQNVTTNL